MSKRDGSSDSVEQSSTSLSFKGGELSLKDTDGQRRSFLSFRDDDSALKPPPPPPPAPSVPETADEWKDLFDVLRAAGVVPYPPELTEDEAAEYLAAVSFSDEVEIEPNPRIAICNPPFYEQYDSYSEYDRSVNQYGRWPRVVRDLARVGVGTIRHVNVPDLSWTSIFESRVVSGGSSSTPSESIPPPGRIYVALTESEFEAFSRFTYLVLACWACSVRVIPLLFDLGGGSPPNESGALSGGEHPPQHRSFCFPSFGGWDEFYYDETRIGHSASSALRVTFQQNCLNVDNPDSEDDYMKEAGRRKRLALDAFGSAVGDYLASLSAALETTYDFALTDVVPYVETGNEMDNYYKYSDATWMPWAAREYAAFHFWLVAPIYQRVTGMRFRLGDAHGWITDHSNWEEIVLWLDELVGVQLSDVVDEWNGIASGSAAQLAVWQDTLDAAAAEEDSWSFAHSDLGEVRLLDEIGFHFFHHTNFPQSLYANEIELGEDISSWIDLLCNTHDLTWSVVVGFPTNDNYYHSIGIDYEGWESDEFTSMGTWYEGSNDTIQAGMAVRRMLFAYCYKGAGGQGPEASFVAWYTHMSSIRQCDDIWDQMTGIGLRNDLVKENHPDWYKDVTGPTDFMCESNAVRRPAWFALQRLAWLLDRTESAKVYEWVDDPERTSATSVLVRLRSKSGSEYYDLDSSDEEPPTWRYAYICWCDLSYPAQNHFWAVTRHGGVDVLSLVPEIDYGSYAAGAVPDDGNGFPEVETVDWLALRPSVPSGALVAPGMAMWSQDVPLCALRNNVLIIKEFSGSSGLVPAERVVDDLLPQTEPAFDDPGQPLEIEPRWGSADYRIPKG